MAAVRSYSQVDRASLQEIDVREGIASTLLVLGHRLRQGVSVVHDHEDVPSIEGHAGELNQVWTDLVGNAIDAMAGHGTLHIATRAGADGGVVVDVRDTVAPSRSSRSRVAPWSGSPFRHGRHRPEVISGPSPFSQSRAG